jgi:hypothetical protein
MDFGLRRSRDNIDARQRGFLSPHRLRLLWDNGLRGHHRSRIGAVVASQCFKSGY